MKATPDDPIAKFCSHEIDRWMDSRSVEDAEFRRRRAIASINWPQNLQLIFHIELLQRAMQPVWEGPHRSTVAIAARAPSARLPWQTIQASFRSGEGTTQQRATPGLPASPVADQSACVGLLTAGAAAGKKRAPSIVLAGGPTGLSEQSSSSSVIKLRRAGEPERWRDTRDSAEGCHVLPMSITILYMDASAGSFTRSSLIPVSADFN